jgi:hypothetical protein
MSLPTSRGLAGIQFVCELEGIAELRDEAHTLNQRVVGSSPTAPTIPNPRQTAASRRNRRFCSKDDLSIPTTAHVWDAMAGRMPYGPLVGLAIDVAQVARAFHWPLEFPDVMERGGFDVVLGNPPWERVKLQEQEFFSARSPEITGAANKAARERLINALEKAPEGSAGRRLFEEFQTAKRLTEAISEFARTPANDGGRFPLTGRGDVNTYALFAELFSRLAGPKGRAGVIVPTGIATDATTAPFFCRPGLKGSTFATG